MVAVKSGFLFCRVSDDANDLMIHVFENVPVDVAAEKLLPSNCQSAHSPFYTQSFRCRSQDIMNGSRLIATRYREQTDYPYFSVDTQDLKEFCAECPHLVSNPLCSIFTPAMLSFFLSFIADAGNGSSTTHSSRKEESSSLSLRSWGCSLQSAASAIVLAEVLQASPWLDQLLSFIIAAPHRLSFLEAHGDVLALYSERTLHYLLVGVSPLKSKEKNENEHENEHENGHENGDSSDSITMTTTITRNHASPPNYALQLEELRREEEVLRTSQAGVSLVSLPALEQPLTPTTPNTLMDGGNDNDGEDSHHASSFSFFPAIESPLEQLKQFSRRLGEARKQRRSAEASCEQLETDIEQLLKEEAAFLNACSKGEESLREKPGYLSEVHQQLEISFARLHAANVKAAEAKSVLEAIEGSLPNHSHPATQPPVPPPRAPPRKVLPQPPTQLQQVPSQPPLPPPRRSQPAPSNSHPSPDSHAQAELEMPAPDVERENAPQEEREKEKETETEKVEQVLSSSMLLKRRVEKRGAVLSPALSEADLEPVLRFRTPDGTPAKNEEDDGSNGGNPKVDIGNQQDAEMDASAPRDGEIAPPHTPSIPVSLEEVEEKEKEKLEEKTVETPVECTLPVRERVLREVQQRLQLARQSHIQNGEEEPESLTEEVTNESPCQASEELEQDLEREDEDEEREGEGLESEGSVNMNMLERSASLSDGIDVSEHETSISDTALVGGQASRVRKVTRQKTKTNSHHGSTSHPKSAPSKGGAATLNGHAKLRRIQQYEVERQARLATELARHQEELREKQQQQEMTGEAEAKLKAAEEQQQAAAIAAEEQAQLARKKAAIRAAESRKKQQMIQEREKRERERKEAEKWQRRDMKIAKYKAEKARELQQAPDAIPVALHTTAVGSMIDPGYSSTATTATTTTTTTTNTNTAAVSSATSSAKTSGLPMKQGSSVLRRVQFKGELTAGKKNRGETVEGADENRENRGAPTSYDKSAPVSNKGQLRLKRKRQNLVLNKETGRERGRETREERLEEEDDQVLEHSSVNEGGHVPLEMEMSLLQPIGDDDMAEFERMEQHAQGQTDALISIPTNATVDADDMALLDQLEADLF
jgi:hypothetical protein